MESAQVRISGHTFDEEPGVQPVVKEWDLEVSWYNGGSMQRNRGFHLGSKRNGGYWRIEDPKLMVY